MVSEVITYLLCCFAFALSILLILRKLAVEKFIICIFTVQTLIYLFAAVWESCVIHIDHVSILLPGARTLYLFGIWGLCFGTMDFLLIILYYLHLEYLPQSKRLVKTLVCGCMIIGCALLFGVIEDFGCFLIRGLGGFNPTDAFWINGWVGGVIPIGYLLQSLIGLLLLVLGVRYSIKCRRVSE
jgi:hypothetical protein